MDYRKSTLGDIALVIIAIFVVIAYFNGWG
jgi:hypothetical protein